MSKTIIELGVPGLMSALTIARFSGSKAITLSPIDSKLSSLLSIYLLLTLLNRISILDESLGESPNNAQSILDSFTGVGMRESAWNMIVFSSSFDETLSISTTVVNSFSLTAKI
jgi:hypothetical protein